MSDIKSIMSKIAMDNILTPYEAIQLQYLNIRQIRRNIPNLSEGADFYSITDSTHSLYSQLELKQLLSFPTLRDAQEYDSYKWAADLLIRYDDASEAITDRCIAIFNELHYFRDEHLITLLTKEDSVIIGPLESYSAFSHVYQRQMSFQHVMESYVTTLKLLIATVDNILTLNYFLSGMVELPDLLCLVNLRKILSNGDTILKDEEQIVAPITILNSTYKQLFESVINTNHPLFVQSVCSHLVAFSWHISSTFENNSLDYARKIMDAIF